MIINLPYGTTLLQLILPDSYDLSIIEPVFTPALAEPGSLHSGIITASNWFPGVVGIDKT